MRRSFVAIAAALLAVAPLGAQTAPVLDHATASRMLDSAIVVAKANNWALSIAVVDANGELLAFTRLDRARLATVEVALGKARTAARFGSPTKGLEERIAGGANQFLSIPGALYLEGGLPLIRDGRVIGAIAASGASSAQDAQVAAAGIAAAGGR